MYLYSSKLKKKKRFKKKLKRKTEKHSLRNITDIWYKSGIPSSHLSGGEVHISEEDWFQNMVQQGREENRRPLFDMQLSSIWRPVPNMTFLKGSALTLLYQET